MDNILLYTLLVILAYLIGSFPTGVLIGQVFFKKDIRDFGSGNTGTTNTFRVLGFWPGMVVLVVDILKGTLGASLPVLFNLGGPHYLILIFGLCSILGHSFSIFLKFKGGKAVATSAGVLLAYNWPFFIISASLFMTLLLITSTVSITSITAMILIFFISFFYHDWILTVVALIVAIFIIWRHRSNIQRIKTHEENIVPFGLYHAYLKRKNKN